MSGLEIFGIAASIIQIADVGVNVSVKLCSFIHQLKHVNQSAQSLSNDVALTSSVLRHLGENLQQDEQARLCSGQALALAQNVLSECEKVFDQINAAMEQPTPSDVKSRLLRSVRKVGLVLSERDMDALRNNLDRLKSTMLLMLNVIMYAGQLRSRKDTVVLKDQRSVVQALAEKQISNGQFGQILCAQPSTQQSDTSVTNIGTGPNTLADPAVPDNLPEDLQTYYLLVRKLLEEVDLCQSKLQPRQYFSVRNGLLRVYKDEQVYLELQYGQDTCRVLHDALLGGERTGGVPMSMSSSSASYVQETFDDDRGSPLLAPFEPDYGSREETPPPFVNVTTSNKAGEEGPSSAPMDDSVRFLDLDQHRPDIDLALDVRSHSLQRCMIQPDPPSITTDIANNALKMLPRNSSQSQSTPPPSTDGYMASLDPPSPGSTAPWPSQTEEQGLSMKDTISHLPRVNLDRYEATIGSYNCSHPGCTASPFETQHLLDSHAKIHSMDRPHYCPVRRCPRGIGGKGFKRKNEMIRHGLVHNSPGYICPFCSDRQHKYPRPDNLQRHVRVHHLGVDPDHPLIRQVLSQRLEGRPRRRRQAEHDDKPDVLAKPCPDIVDSLLLAWTTLKSDEVSVPVPYVQE